MRVSVLHGPRYASVVTSVASVGGRVQWHSATEHRYGPTGYDGTQRSHYGVATVVWEMHLPTGQLSTPESGEFYSSQ